MENVEFLYNMADKLVLVCVNNVLGVGYSLLNIGYKILYRISNNETVKVKNKKINIAFIISMTAKSKHFKKVAIKKITDQ